MSDLAERLEFTGRARFEGGDLDGVQYYRLAEIDAWFREDSEQGGVEFEYVAASATAAGSRLVAVFGEDAREPPVGSVVRVVTSEVAVRFCREGRGWAPDEDAVTVERWAELFHGATCVELLALPSTADVARCSAAEDTATGMDDAVLRFHRLMGCAVAEPRNRWAAARRDLLLDEVDELVAALGSEDDAQVMRELADVVYVAVGTAVALGYRLQPVFDEVCAANLRKLGPDGKPILRPGDGKVMKPEGWTPPDVASVMIPVSGKDGS